MKLLNLLENEVMKIIYRKRLLIIGGILLVLILLFAYGEQYRADRSNDRLMRRMGENFSNDWRAIATQQITDLNNRLTSPYMQEERKASIRVQIEQLQYYLDKDINPLVIGSANFTRTFMEQSIYLFLPLLIIILASDLVSGEFTSGTIKLLLTKSVPRWKVLASKYIVLVLMTTVVVMMTALLSVSVSGLFFGHAGWQAPVATGFKVIAGELDTSAVQSVPQWKYIGMVYGLSWFVAVAIATISFMVSVLVKSTAVAMGVMLSSLIGGGFLTFFVSDWPMAKYFFMLNLRLTDYLSGSFQPVEGMSMIFSIGVLFAWAIASLIVSFWVFTKQDILV